MVPATRAKQGTHQNGTARRRQRIQVRYGHVAGRLQPNHTALRLARAPQAFVRCFCADRWTRTSRAQCALDVARSQGSGQSLHTHAHTYAHTRTHAHTPHTHTHTHTHTQIRMCSGTSDVRPCVTSAHDRDAHVLYATLKMRSASIQREAGQHSVHALLVVVRTAA